MKTKIQKLIYLFIASFAIYSCSSDSQDEIQDYETPLLGSWEYFVTPHPSGSGSTSTYYKSYFILLPDKTGITGFDEVISPIDHFSGSNNITWSANSTQIIGTYSNGTVETKTYVFINANKIKINNTDGTFMIYNKQ